MNVKGKPCLRILLNNMANNKDPLPIMAYPLKFNKTYTPCLKVITALAKLVEASSDLAPESPFKSDGTTYSTNCSPI